tara:strand:- start:532 stop:660 length:129 start_codon:yes stop_codon:yes gene_type:complete
MHFDFENGIIDKPSAHQDLCGLDSMIISKEKRNAYDLPCFNK